MDGGQLCVTQHGSAPCCGHTPSSPALGAEQKIKARASQLSLWPTASSDVCVSHHLGAPGPCHGLLQLLPPQGSSGSAPSFWLHEAQARSHGPLLPPPLEEVQATDLAGKTQREILARRLPLPSKKSSVPVSPLCSPLLRAGPFVS